MIAQWRGSDFPPACLRAKTGLGALAAPAGRLQMNPRADRLSRGQAERLAVNAAPKFVSDYRI
jgi:hypothetical protein